MSEVKPCPFCGKTPIVNTYISNSETWIFLKIECCPIKILKWVKQRERPLVPFDTLIQELNDAYKTLLEEWNTRAEVK